MVNARSGYPASADVNTMNRRLSFSLHERHVSITGSKSPYRSFTGELPTPSAGLAHFSTAPVGIVVTNNLYPEKSERAKLPHAREFRDHLQTCVPPGKLR